MPVNPERIMLSVAGCHPGEYKRDTDTRSVGEWGSMATSPEIIHGTTPARDLFSFVAAYGFDYQSREAPQPRFSTTVSPCFCVDWPPRPVGKLWMTVHKPALIRNVRWSRPEAFFVRCLASDCHYRASLSQARTCSVRV